MLSSLYWCSENIPRWHLIAICIIGYVLYYLIEVVKVKIHKINLKKKKTIRKFFLQQRPILAVSDGAFKKFLLQNVPTIESKFWPTIWCIESRAQTFVASILRSSIFPTIHYRRCDQTINSN